MFRLIGHGWFYNFYNYVRYILIKNYETHHLFKARNDPSFHHLRQQYFYWSFYCLESDLSEPEYSSRGIKLTNSELKNIWPGGAGSYMPKYYLLAFKFGKTDGSPIHIGGNPHFLFEYAAEVKLILIAKFPTHLFH